MSCYWAIHQPVNDACISSANGSHKSNKNHCGSDGVFWGEHNTSIQFSIEFILPSQQERILTMNT